MTIQIPNMNRDKRDGLLNMLKNEMEAQLDEGKPLCATAIVAGLPLDGDNACIRELALENGITAKAFDGSFRQRKIVDELGAVPRSPKHLVQLILERDGISCRYNGLLHRASKRSIDVEGKRIDLNPGDLNDPAVATLAHFKAPKRMTVSELTLNLRTTTANLKLGFSDTSIRDAVDLWMNDAKRERLAVIFIQIEHARLSAPARAKAAELWDTLVEKTFDTSETSVGFVVAVLRKFVWSVKRKMRGLTVTNHIMAVVLGPQGVGKTVFVKNFTRPVEEVSIDVDFSTLEESRNIEIWRFYVHILDEMGYASKADCETTKRVITADTITRRPMGSNGVETITQNATMIGCSNKELNQLINDPTGNRRFAPIRFRTDADWCAINEADYTMLWQSVDENGPDPMIDHMGTLRELQAASRQLGPVEQWLMDFRDQGSQKVVDGQKIAPKELYEQYRTWEQEFQPGSRATDFSVWRAEMARLIKNDKGILALPLRRSEQRASYGYPFVFQRVGEDVR